MVALLHYIWQVRIFHLRLFRNNLFHHAGLLQSSPDRKLFRHLIIIRDELELQILAFEDLLPWRDAQVFVHFVWLDVLEPVRSGAEHLTDLWLPELLLGAKRVHLYADLPNCGITYGVGALQILLDSCQVTFDHLPSW